jgi:hypothetical protein
MLRVPTANKRHKWNLFNILKREKGVTPMHLSDELELKQLETFT